MKKFRHLDIVYQYFLAKTKNPRLTINDFFPQQNAYESTRALGWLLRDAYALRIISRPELFVNIGVSFELQNTDENQLELLKKCKNDPKTTYAIALCGAYSFLRVYKGASDLKFADRVVPVYPDEITPQEIVFDKEGELENDCYPHGWDEIDWEVYELMKDPTTSFTDALRQSKKEGSGLNRKTIRDHFKKILKDCKVHMNFFPDGYKSYDQVFLKFKTEYEIGLYETLKKLDRTSFLWKVNDFILLTLFVHHYCATVRRFKELEEKGLIQHLKVSIPNRHYTPFQDDF